MAGWQDGDALHLPNFDLFGEAAVLVELASLAEESDWDGFFIWDHLEWPGSEPAVDPWVALAAISVGTDRIRLGTMITPLPRRDIVKLARETVSVDRLSGGRLVSGVGLGWETIPEWDVFGHESDKRVRGEMLDEGLEVPGTVALSDRGVRRIGVAPLFGQIASVSSSNAAAGRRRWWRASTPSS